MNTCKICRNAVNEDINIPGCSHVDPEYLEARSLRNINAEIPSMFILIAAQDHELRKRRPVVERGTL